MSHLRSNGAARSFEALFVPRARDVRLRLAARHALSGAVAGLVVGVVVAIAAWRGGATTLRASAPATALVGVGAGILFARARRWSDTEVALYLDDVTGSAEAITTAVELRKPTDGVPDREDLRRTVDAKAALALEGEPPLGPLRLRGPAVWRRVHGLGALALLAWSVVVLQPMPPPPVVAPGAPGAGTITRADVVGLERALALRHLTARDDAQHQRLEALAKDAERLRDDLRRGLPQREAQDRIARLKEAITEERLSLGGGERRAGLESATSRLGRDAATRGAAKALGDLDLQRFDEEMERIANQREAEDRASARHTLEDAAAAARRERAEDVARALDEERQSLDARARRAELLRELAEAMASSGTASEEVGKLAEDLDARASDAAARKLADAMGRALEKLTPEERERLARKLAEQRQRRGSAGAGGDLKEMADALKSPEGQKKLEERLRDMAREDMAGGESKRSQGLEDAEEGLDEAEGQLVPGGAVPLPSQGGPSHGSGSQGNGAQANGQQGSGQQGSGQQGNSSQANGAQGDTAGSGPSRGGGPGDHQGTTAPVQGDTLTSRARPKALGARGMPGSVTTFVPGRAGGSTVVPSTGDLATARGRELSGVEHSDVPEEYREQVRQYFQP